MKGIVYFLLLLILFPILLAIGRLLELAFYPFLFWLALLFAVLLQGTSRTPRSIAKALSWYGLTTSFLIGGILVRRAVISMTLFFIPVTQRMLVFGCLIWYLYDTIELAITIKELKLLPLLKSEDPDTRRKAAESLGRLRNSSTVGVLITSLGDKDPGIREAAVRTLEEIDPGWRETEGAKKALSVFARLLISWDSNTRQRMTWVLEQIGPNWREREEVGKKFPWLMASLADVNPHIQEGVAWILDQINPEWRKTEEAKELTYQLIDSLQNWDPLNVRAARAWALQEITGQNFGLSYKRWMHWWERNEATFGK